MKRLLTLLFAFAITASLSMLAQEPAANPGGADKKTEKAEKKEAKAAAKDKAMSLTGWVKDQDGKTVFINDKDKQAWNIENMDAVKGHRPPREGESEAERGRSLTERGKTHDDAQGQAVRRGAERRSP